LEALNKCHLTRWPLATSYVKVVDDVVGLIDYPTPRGSTLAVDFTGVGRPVVDLLRQRRPPCQLVPCTITGGAHSTCDQHGWSVSKRELVSVLNVLTGTDRLRVAEALPLARVLVAEFGTFRARVTPTGHEELAAPWREGSHDDILLAVSLACWLGERVPPVNGEPPVVLTPGRVDPATGENALGRFDDLPRPLHGNAYTGLPDGPPPRVLRPDYHRWY
jgi:hypothetical protein